MQRRFYFILCTLVCGLLIGKASSATSLMKIDAVDSVDQAEMIFTGTVVSTEYITTLDGKFPFTFVTFAVDRVLKGKVADELTLRFDGGDLVETQETVEVVGMPTFEVGDEALLFVAGNGKYACPVVGWWQGKLDIVRHPSTLRPMLIDHRGYPVEGVDSSGRWLHGHFKWTQAEKFEHDQVNGSHLLWQHGVSILEEKEALRDPHQYQSTPIPSILDEILDLIRRRSIEKNPGFQPGAEVLSASPMNVPRSMTFTAAPPG